MDNGALDRLQSGAGEARRNDDEIGESGAALHAGAGIRHLLEVTWEVKART